MGGRSYVIRCGVVGTLSSPPTPGSQCPVNRVDVQSSLKDGRTTYYCDMDILLELFTGKRSN